MRILGVAFIVLAGCTDGVISTPTRVVNPFDPSQPVDPNHPIDPKDPTKPPPDLCEGVAVAAAPTALRRLTVEQLKSSYRDVLKDAAAAPDLAPIAGPIITEQEVEKLNLAAKALVARKGHHSYAPCNVDGAINSACADTFIESFGHMLFRRPLTVDERTAIKSDVYEKLRTNAALTPPATFRELIDSTAEAMLQSPELLYIHEEGVSDASLPQGVRRLTGNERAVRLSYLLLGSTPDQALLAAAEGGQLDTADGVRAQGERLLMDPRARKAVRSVVNAWLELDGNSHQASLETAPKDAARFPMDSASLRTAMREELLALYERAFFDESGKFSALMTSRKAYVNKSLGQLYGVTAGLPANDTTSAWVDLNETERAGLFTRAGFLALYAPQDLQSPIRRGVFLYRNALGLTLGAPPPNVDNTPLKPMANALSVRDQVEARTQPAGCQACHGRINPLGFTLESYDALGRFQTQENGTLDGVAYTAPVNAKATIVGTDFAGEVNGPVELAMKLATSNQAHDALAKVWFARANERPAVSADACNLQRLTQRFRQTDDMRDLLVSLAAADSSLFLQESP